MNIKIDGTVFVNPSDNFMDVVPSTSKIIARIR
jgi:hypothetical protein